MWPLLLRTAFQSLVGSPLRSGLAVLGVVIGVGAVVAMLAIGTGAQHKVLEDVGSEGALVLSIFPEGREVEGVYRQPQSLYMADAEALAALPGAVAGAPVATTDAQVRSGPKTETVPVVATVETWSHMNSAKLSNGRWFTSAESEVGSAVCVIGSSTAKKLLGDESPIDAIISIGPLPVRVIGLLKEQGKRGWEDPDNRIIMPLITARRGILPSAALAYIQVQGRDDQVLDNLREECGRELLRRHRLTDPSRRDFAVHLNRDILNRVQDFLGVFKALLGGIGSISLLVGGIGIMNIMLVTVTERTREIGLRKAVGARERDIRNQFLVEAVAITGSGGALGILLGWGLATIAGKFMPFPPAVDLSSIIIALGFSGAVGLFFGWYPAVRAARLDPIEALRHE